MIDGDGFLVSQGKETLVYWILLYIERLNYDSCVMKLYRGVLEVEHWKTNNQVEIGAFWLGSFYATAIGFLLLTFLLWNVHFSPSPWLVAIYTYACIRIFFFFFLFWSGLEMSLVFLL